MGLPASGRGVAPGDQRPQPHFAVLADRINEARKALPRPVTAFSEWTAAPDPATGRKRKIWFDVPAQPVFAFAGIWRPTAEHNRFAFLTTMANGLVALIHPKAMPFILHPDEWEKWMTGDFATVCAMADAYPDDEMRIFA